MTDDIAATGPVIALDDGPSDEAPYGWMTDPVTGEKRPKKRPGRRSRGVTPPSGTSPSIQDLQALGTLAETSEDTAPGVPPKGGRKKPAMKAAVELPPFRAGVIAKGINGLYRRTGRLMRLWDYDIGTAVIASTKVMAKDDEDDGDTEDVTVGEAWEALAKTNPRIRAFLLKLITGGAWSSLFIAHAPIFMAVAMKDGIRERLPLAGLMDAFLTDEPEGESEGAGGPVPSAMAQMLGGIGPQDMAQMMQMAQGMMGQVANGMPRSTNIMPRDPAADQE